MVDTNTQCASETAPTARRTCDGRRDTSTTASYSAASPAGGSSARSQGSSAAPSGTSPDTPRQAQVTSCPRRSASAATSRDRNTVPPSTSSLMRPPSADRPGTDKRFRAKQKPPTTPAPRSRGFPLIRGPKFLRSFGGTPLEETTDERISAGHHGDGQRAPAPPPGRAPGGADSLRARSCGGPGD